jgi:hypothetical protein
VKPLPGVVATLLLAMSACSDPPIAWEEPVALPTALSGVPRLAFDAQNRLAADTAPGIEAPLAPGQCPASVRLARDTTGQWYAAWWALRPDSTADLVVAFSPDGVSWEPPVKVDTLDTAPVGCRRFAPSIAADSGNVHVAYAMAAREGPGIFASHSMDRGTMFHTPVAVVYGERIGATAVAARGWIVAVAYEDPNGTLDRIGLALSTTMAHLFQHRMTVSGSEAARRPDVAIGRDRIAVTWARGADTTARFLRMGDLQ